MRARSSLAWWPDPARAAAAAAWGRSLRPAAGPLPRHLCWASSVTMPANLRLSAIRGALSHGSQSPAPSMAASGRPRRSPALTAAELQQYRSDGFLFLRGFFDPEELQPVMAGIDAKVERLARRLVQAGKISDPHTDLGFLRRLAAIEADWPGAAVAIHMERDLDEPTRALWSHPRLLDMVESVIGPEVAGHPVWNLRSKTPSTALTTVPWHQDIAYLSPGTEEVEQPAAWIPLLDVSERNGTLKFVRGGGRNPATGEPIVLPHFLEKNRKSANSHSMVDSASSANVSAGHKDSWYVYAPDEALPTGEVVSADVSLGDVVLLGNCTPHCTTENLSRDVRWSLDLRWQAPEQPCGFEWGAQAKGTIINTATVLMRTAGAETPEIDWEGFSPGCTMSEEEKTRLALATPVAEPEISGPWMDRWEQQA